MFSNTRKSKRRRNVPLTCPIIPASIGWIRIVVLGGRKYKSTFASSGITSFEPWAEQLSIDSKIFRFCVLPMYLSNLPNHGNNNLLFIQAFWLLWQSNLSSCPYFPLEGRGHSARPTILTGNFSDPSELQQGKNVILGLSFLCPVVGLLDNDHPGGCRKNNPNSSASHTFSALYSDIFSLVWGNACCILSSSALKASPCTRHNLMLYLLWKRSSHPLENLSDSRPSRGKCLFASAWSRSACMRKKTPLICAPIDVLSQSQLYRADSRRGVDALRRLSNVDREDGGRPR